MQRMKSLIWAIDSRYLNRRLKVFRLKLLIKRRFSNVSFYRIENHLSQELQFFSDLCDKYGSDKSSNLRESQIYPWAPHNYGIFYTTYFSSLRYKIMNVFECGIGTNNPNLVSSMTTSGIPGASLRVWRDYFPNALVLGADIDREILFSDKRIITSYVDQTDISSIQSLFRSTKENFFDLMIDDGLHTFVGGSTLLTNAFPYLKEGGIYAIEDINLSDLSQWELFLKRFEIHYRLHVFFGKAGRELDILLVIRHVN